MYSNNSHDGRAAPARGFIALWAMLAMGLSSMAGPAEAAPFAYVTNSNSSTVSVIDTATNPPTVVGTIAVGSSPLGVAITPDGKHAYVVNIKPKTFGTVSVIDTASNIVVATVAVGLFPYGVAVTPDGKHVYVVNQGDRTVSVIDTASNTVVATVPVGTTPFGVAVAPEGQQAYVTNSGSHTVSVIATASNTVVATITVGLDPIGVAITPDGKHAYVANGSDDTVSVIGTASNTVMTTVAVGTSPVGVAITPDGKQAYVANQYSNNVLVIATASNTVVATVPVGTNPIGVAITPDGKHAYVANSNSGSNNVSVIRTATNRVVATVPVGNTPYTVAIVPPPPGVPFLAFSATALDIAFGTAPNQDSFNLHSLFTVSSTAPAIHPHRDQVTLQVGTFSVTIPSGSFTKQPDGFFFFSGMIDGVSLKARITPTATLQYAFHAKATGASLTGTKNPVYVTLIIGGDSGATSVTAAISPSEEEAHMGG